MMLLASEACSNLKLKLGLLLSGQKLGKAVANKKKNVWLHCYKRVNFMTL